MSITPCPSDTPISRGVVVFDPAVFKAAFPEFATISDAALTANFGFAELQLNNTCKSFICNAALREKLLNLLVAHITQLRNGINGQPATGVVGRASYAMEGSVAFNAEMGTVVYGQAYYNQTMFGTLFWQSTAFVRSMRYIPAPSTCYDEFPGYFGDGGCGC